jgi:flagellar biosynthetic protein FlhB
MVEAAIAMIIMSLPDYLFQRYQHRESLKMTKQEVKEERKTTEGDPQIRGRLRERMRDLLGQNQLQNVPEADVVVTNPTHYAIALQWDQERMVAPMVTAKGQDNIAQRIREVAKENNVPIMENKPLARALYSEVEIGDTIPERYYEVMAIILAEVYRMSGKEQVS